MPRYNDLIENLKLNPIFCNNLGYGEEGAVLSQLKNAIYVCQDLNKAHDIYLQLKALNKNCVLVDEFSKPFTLSKFESEGTKFDLIKALENVYSNDCIVISTPQIFFTFLPNKQTFLNHCFSLEKNKEYNIEQLEKFLISVGYKKNESVTSAGEFARRGDILDIFNTTSEHPIRLDFFDNLLEDMYFFDSISFEKLNKTNSFLVMPNSLTFFSEQEKNILNNNLKVYSNLSNNYQDLINAIENNQEIPAEFIYPFSKNYATILDLDYPMVISDQIQFEFSYKKLFESFNEKIKEIFINENFINFYKNSKKIYKINDFYSYFSKKLIFFADFDLNTINLNEKLNSKKIININFECIKFSNYLNNLEKLQLELSQYKDKQIYLCLSNKGTLNSVKQVFQETKVNFSTNKNEKGIILTELSIPFNICFKDSDKLYIGSTNFAHKKEFKLEKQKTIKYLPKAGEYVVHSTHGIGKCEGIVTVNVSGVDKEFFKLIYRGGDILYVPYENADCLSLYLAEEGSVNLNKLGGKEFFNQKMRAVKSIEDMSKELLELYAKRKAVKGFKYSEDDYLYTEFENAFSHTETADQLHAIYDIKNDMINGKVMDRLICGDVGFGKTEVALRAVFKAFENGKQVAFLAPTTILSLQHYMTTVNRMKDFGVRVQMLNRFKSVKEQNQIIKDLKDGKIDVICGTHRLLSNDVQFKDLGLLVLDEEQRFGVKAKEKIKQMKNNIDVLTLSATPIPRTLSMTLMNIRDISIINTPPVNRLPVKTYVLAYNQSQILTAINDEINRGGQVLIVYNNIQKIYTLANRLKNNLNNDKAVFDVAHGQMSKIALENAIKRLYDGETNVFVSTTLIENGVDLPNANTLIVIDSDKLGLSQMYQLRGRVGRSNEQAYAYFTYDKEKVLTEESTSRLQAIAENTELGSGFKIAMRDLQIRGAGELLGKVQHGHMVKIGYEMYSKLLNDTLKRLRGEKVDVERDVKIDIAITSKIPYNFVDDETERLKIIAKISNIKDKNSARNVLNELLAEYGKLPNEIYQLANVSLLKALAIKQKVKQIILNKSKMSVVFYEDVHLTSLMQKVNKFTHFKFEKGSSPSIYLDPKEFSVQTSMNYLIEFLID